MAAGTEELPASSQNKSEEHEQEPENTGQESHVSLFFITFPRRPAAPNRLRALLPPAKRDYGFFADRAGNELELFFCYLEIENSLRKSSNASKSRTVRLHRSCPALDE